MGRNTVQIPMANGEILFELGLGPGFSSTSPQNFMKKL